MWSAATILQRCLGAIHGCSGARAIHGSLRAIHGSPSIGGSHATWTLGVNCGEPLAVHRDGLAGRVQFYSGCGLRGILHHTNVAFVGSLGDTHSLAYELIVSSPSTPAHATWASKTTMLTCRVGGCGSPGIMFVPLMLCPQPGHPQISLYQREPPKLG